MAAMTLLLAHLDSPLSETENLLAHRYHSDRAMIEQVQENMEEVNRLNSDILSAKSASLLSRLLAIEVEAVPGSSLGAKGVSVQKTGPEMAIPDQDEMDVSVNIPYFGVIRIAHKGVTKEVTELQYSKLTRPPNLPNDRNSGRAMCTENPTFPSKRAEAGESSMTAEVESAISNNNYTESPSETSDIPVELDQHRQYKFPDPSVHDEEYPGLAAGMEDWTFQGVDLAFFDNLMGSTGPDGTLGVDFLSDTTNA
jgi:hypothetical protein